ncbi:MAG: hypothetical protein AAB609_00210 [Patescibacteria group bacterium]
MKKKILKMNEFFDINKLSSEKGLLLFGLSMGKLRGRQNAANCLKDIKHFSPNKVAKPLIGLNFIYTDFLYLYNSKEKADILKNSFMSQVIQHKNSMQKVLEKNQLEFQIQHAFNYLVWNQLYVGTKDFDTKFQKIKKIYSKDKKFKEFIKKDCADFNKKPTNNQINFFLEESLMVYLLVKNQVKLPNEYVEGNQKWTLFCYPGKPARSIIYLLKLNPFKIDWKESPYQDSFYDLDSKKLIVASRVDLENYSLN